MPKPMATNPNARWFTQGGLGWINLAEQFIEDGCPVSPEQLVTLRSIAARLGAACDKAASQYVAEDAGRSGEDHVNMIATEGATAAELAATAAATDEQPQKRRKGHPWPTRP